MNLASDNPQLSIWIIDDDQSMRWVLEKTLSNNGYQVTAFESGSVALASFKRAQPEVRPRLIITDVRMPGINGFELLKQIKNISPLTPIIVMTAYTDLDTTVQAFQEGAFERFGVGRSFPVAEHIGHTALYVPVHQGLTAWELGHIFGALLC